MMMSKQPHAEQIFILDESNKIILDSDALRKILLNENIKEKNVCIISIAGAFRQGKSFMLNFLIRYLQTKSKLKGKNVTKWLDVMGGAISGFSWESGSKRHTMGILMWSEIFIIELPTGEETAIVLLDTQGSFDNSSTMTQCATIFALSTLISSVQMYNLKENINQSDLGHLECFSEYGQLVLQDGSELDRTPFQKLIFLIRDWQWEFEKPYGFKGGRQLLNEVLDTDNKQAEELVSQKNHVKELFSDIDCFLMPHPGQEVATSQKFGGDLKDIDSKFRKYVEEFVSNILSPQNIVPKTINRQRIKVKDLVDIIEAYWECFRNGEMPPVQSLFQATADIQHKVALNESLNLYEESMQCIQNEDYPALEGMELNKKHINSKRKALAHYDQKKKMGDKATTQSYKDELNKKLEKGFAEYINLNELKRKNEQNLFNWIRNMIFGNRQLSTIIPSIIPAATATVSGCVRGSAALAAGTAVGTELFSICAISASVGALVGLGLSVIVVVGFEIHRRRSVNASINNAETHHVNNEIEEN